MNPAIPYADVGRGLPVDRQLPVDAFEVGNAAAKYLARSGAAPWRHNYGQFGPDDSRAQFCDAWRFPLISTYRADGIAIHRFNRVTFVFAAESSTWAGTVSLLCTFNGYGPISLTQVVFPTGPTRYWAASVAIPIGEVHYYRFAVNGVMQIDPINPQRSTLDSGKVWSRFFTDFCGHRLALEPWEMAILQPLTDHILPLRTGAGQQFLAVFFRDLPSRRFAPFQIDEPSGAVNFIDNLLAREEAHHLVDYQTCLDIIRLILEARFPGLPPERVPRTVYADLYAGMAAGNGIPGWDYSRYSNPTYFLQLLRRHTYTGAFSHPRYGGNVGAIGWRYLEATYRGPADENCFDWKRALEAPPGANIDYRG